MAVTVKLPTQLRDGRRRRRRPSRSRARRSARSLDALFDRARRAARPAHRQDGGLRRFVNVYVDGEDMRSLDGLDTPVREGGQLTILPAVAGG